MPLEHGYFVGGNEARARGLIAPPGGAVFPLSVLEAHPLRAGKLVVQAEVNHGRWVARCPFCSGAEAVTAALPVFWCDDCQMAQADGLAAKVAFPNGLDALEAELERRPAHRRNLTADDLALAKARGIPVVELLRAENIVHGVTPSTVAERILAKATLWGNGAVVAELGDLEVFGADYLERRYHEGGPGTWDPHGGIDRRGL